MELWQLTQSHARLTGGPLQARVDVLNPARGMHDLAWNSMAIDGCFFGVTVAEGSAAASPVSTEGLDRYVRGTDLVVNYPEGERQRFTLHMYWRIAESSPTATVIDAIVSLQTSLLECFPKAKLTTSLPGSELMLIGTDARPSVLDVDCLSSDQPGAVLVRGNDVGWSYVEMTHPADLGCWRLTRAERIQMERELGGEFQEKGVIRRLRVRSAFVPRDRDLQYAQQVIDEFAAAPPALTA